MSTQGTRLAGYEHPRNALNEASWKYELVDAIRLSLLKYPRGESETRGTIPEGELALPVAPVPLPPLQH